MAPGIFVTATDTDIGKTYVSRLLVEAIGETTSVTYMKPVQTGCSRDKTGDPVAPDLEWVARAREFRESATDYHAPFCYERACSPHLAARIEGRPISLQRIRECFGRLSASADCVVVEGAGGVLAPLSDSESMLDLMRLLALPVVLVTSPRLGTLNHTFLSIDAVLRAGLSLCGIVVNNALNLPHDDVYVDNRVTIRSRFPQIPFVETGFRASLTPAFKEFVHEIV